MLPVNLQAHEKLASGPLSLVNAPLNPLNDQRSPRDLASPLNPLGPVNQLKDPVKFRKRGQAKERLTNHLRNPSQSPEKEILIRLYVSLSAHRFQRLKE